MATQQTRTAWGRMKFGSGRVSAMAIAIPSGVTLGAVVGLLSVLIGLTGPHPVLGGVVFALCLTVPATLLVYILVVDRNTLDGAAERPDDSIESRWYERAAAGAFTDIILVIGVGATVLAFISTDFFVDLKLVLPAVIGVCFASFGIRYLLLRRRG